MCIERVIPERTSPSERQSKAQKTILSMFICFPELLLFSLNNPQRIDFPTFRNQLLPHRILKLCGMTLGKHSCC